MATLKRRDLAQAFLRSLWLQAAWSFQGMQSLGFAYAMDPVLKRLYGEKEAHASALTRHLEFLNTHPFLAAAILGCSIRLEQEGGDQLEEAARRLKNALMGPLGALGDSLYWGALKPLFVLVALHAAYREQLWAPWLFLGLFTVANLTGRLYGFCQGYRKGLAVVDSIATMDLPTWSRRIKACCAVLLGSLLAGVAGPTPIDEWQLSPWFWGTGAWVLVVVGSWVVGRGVRPAWMVCIAMLISGALVALT